MREPPGRRFLSLRVLEDPHSEAPGSLGPSPALTPPPTPAPRASSRIHGACCICLPAALLSTYPVTLLPNPVISPPTVWPGGWGWGLSR